MSASPANAGQHQLVYRQPTEDEPMSTLTLGPVVLWLDVEFAELPALEGATSLLDRVLLANVETFCHRDLPAICRLMHAHGLEMMRVWNVGESVAKDAQDYVFVRRK